MITDLLRKYLGVNVSRYAAPKIEKPLAEQGQKKVRVGNFALHANESHLIEDHLSHYEYYSRNLGRIARIIGETYPSSWIIDVGANIGDSIALIRSEHCNNPICAVEGDRNYFAILKRNMDEMFPDVQLKNVFLGETKKIIRSELVAEGGTLNIKQDSNTGNPVEIVTLDELVAAANMQDIKLIKVDTDGFDFMILRGAGQTIDAQKPVLFLEYDDKFLRQNNEDGLATLKALQNKGYDRIMYYDNFGRFLTSGRLGEMEFIEDMYLYIKDRKGAFPYFDLCIFHNSDETLADKVIAGERAYFRNH